MFEDSIEMSEGVGPGQEISFIGHTKKSLEPTLPLRTWIDNAMASLAKQKQEIQQPSTNVSKGFLTSVRVACGYVNVEHFVRGTLLDLFISSLEISDGMISIVKNGETILSYDAALEPETVMYAITCYAVGKDFDFPGDIILPDTEITNKLLKRAGERFGDAV